MKNMDNMETAYKLYYMLGKTRSDYSRKETKAISKNSNDHPGTGMHKNLSSV